MNIVRKFFSTAKVIARKIIDVLIRIVLAVVYFVFIAPFGIFVRLFKDYLKIKPEPFWQSRKEISDIDDFLKRQ